MDQPKLPATSPTAVPEVDGFTDAPTPPLTTNGQPPLLLSEPPLSPEGFRTVPDHTNPGWPAGVPYIIGNEACERFSYYGMKAILQVHLTALYVALAYAERAEVAATQMNHLFMAGVYAFPMIGALVADRWAGKYKTIIYLSLVYCAGHAVLSVYENQLWGMALGLALISIGSGGIKPCVSANVGDQFGKANIFRVRTIYQIFYFSINFGSFFATLLIPFLRAHSGQILIDKFPDTFGGMDPLRLGTSIAFGLPGVLMFIATFIFWLGRHKFVHAPPRPGGRIGLLDTACAVSLFLSVGHLFATASLMQGPFPDKGAGYWLSLGAFTAGFLGIGLYLFNLRQRLAPDDGFLAITLHVVRSHLGLGAGTPASPAPSTPVASAADAALARSWFWRPGVQRFGLAATEGPVAVFKIISVFFLILFFWALFEQHSSTWITQARGMDLWLWGEGSGSFLGIPNVRLDASQTSAMNPALVMLLIPIMNLVYRYCDRLGIQTTPLRRITVGMFFTGASFIATAILQKVIDSNPPGSVWFGWQFVQYVIVTIGEVMVSITGLEFAYTQAPKKMKSTVMGFWLIFVTLGNMLVVVLAGARTSLTGWVNANVVSGLGEAETFFWICAVLCLAAGVVFMLRAMVYTPRDYTQE